MEHTQKTWETSLLLYNSILSDPTLQKPQCYQYSSLSCLSLYCWAVSTVSSTGEDTSSLVVIDPYIMQPSIVICFCLPYLYWIKHINLLTTLKNTTLFIIIHFIISILAEHVTIHIFLFNVFYLITNYLDQPL